MRYRAAAVAGLAAYGAARVAVAVVDALVDLYVRAGVRR